MNIDRSKKFDDFFTKSTKMRPIDYLVLHHIEANSVNDAIFELEKHEVSAHFIVGEDGKIFELVDENDIAHHAGVSFWKGDESLNKNSIGIEFVNSSPFTKKFSQEQMISAVMLCKYLKAKYRIHNSNIVAHSDIAYKDNFLDRKQDPSHFFDWKFLALNLVGIYPDVGLLEDKEMFKFGDKNEKISLIKKKLAKFGYRILNDNDEFDQEMQCLARVFNRRFNQESFVKNSDIWYDKSDLVLQKLVF